MAYEFQGKLYDDFELNKEYYTSARTITEADVVNFAGLSGDFSALHINEEYAKKLRDYTIALYKKCADYALTRGIIIADTKFEFGLDENGSMVLGDEMLTPDSSRFWPADGYEPGHGQPSFDKQFARDWLKANPDNDWTLPEDIVEKTIAKYLQAYEMLTGKQL